MEEWIVMQHPGLLFLYGAALFLCLFEKKNRATKGIVFGLCGLWHGAR